MNQTMQTGMQPGREPNRWAAPRRPVAGPLPELVSRSLAMRRVCEQLQQVGPRVRLALIEGEAGTGKHLLARHIQARHASPGLLVVEEAASLFLSGPPAGRNRLTSAFRARRQIAADAR